MKHLFLALTVSFSGLLVALPVGNPAEPKLFTQGAFQNDCWVNSSHPLSSCLNNLSFRIGYYVDIVKNRNLTQQDVNCDTNQDTLASNVNTYAGYLVGNFCDRFDIFVTLGTTNYQYSSSTFDWGRGGNASSALLQANNGKSSIFSSNEFSWSAGGRLIAFECGHWTIGVEGQYLQARPKIQYLDVPGANTSVQLLMGSCGLTTNYSEWQIGLGTSWQVGWIVPYMGVKWSSTRLKMGDPIWSLIRATPNTSVIGLKNLEQSKTWGFAVGTSLVSCDMGGVTIEARFADEIGYYINGQLRF